MEHAVLITVKGQPGTPYQLVCVLTERQANITYVDIIHRFTGA